MVPIRATCGKSDPARIGTWKQVGQFLHGYRKLLKISWVDRVTNEDVLNLVNEKRSLHASIKRLRDRLIVHTLRHEGLAGTILEGTVEGRIRKR